MQTPSEPISQEIVSFTDEWERRLKESWFASRQAIDSLAALLLEGPKAVPSEQSPKFLEDYERIKQLLADPDEKIRKRIRAVVALRCVSGHQSASYLHKNLRGDRSMIAISFSLKSLHGFQLIHQALSAADRVPELMPFRFDTALVDDELWNAFCNIFPDVPHLKSVAFAEDYLKKLFESDIQVQQLCSAFQRCSELSRLSFLGIGLPQFSAKAFQNFCQMLVALTHISSLRMASSYMNLWSEERWDQFLRMLKTATHIDSIELENNILSAISPLRWKRLCDELKRMRSLKIMFSLTEDRLDAPTWSRFCEVLTEGNVLSFSLDSISLAHLVPSQWELFGRGLGRIRELSLFGLGTTEPAPWIAALRSAPHLRVLVLGNSLGTLDTAGWTMFCQMLGKASELTSLGLMNNGLKRIDLPERDSLRRLIKLVDAFQLLFHLEVVNLVQEGTEGSLPASISERITKILERNRLLRDAKQEGDVLLQQLVTPETPDTAITAPRVEERLEKLKQVIALLQQEQTSQAENQRTNVRSLHDLLALRAAQWFVLHQDEANALHFYQEISSVAPHFVSARLEAFLLVLQSHLNAKLTMAEAFLKALPLCFDDHNRMIQFVGRVTNDFDGFLLRAVGIPEKDVLANVSEVTPEIRRKLLQVLLLQDLGQRLGQRAPTAFFHQSQSQTHLGEILALALPPIISLEELKAVPISEVWGVAQEWLQQAPLPAEVDIYKEYRMGLTGTIIRPRTTWGL